MEPATPVLPVDAILVGRTRHSAGGGGRFSPVGILMRILVFAVATVLLGQSFCWPFDQVLCANPLWFCVGTWSFRKRGEVL